MPADRPRRRLPHCCCRCCKDSNPELRAAVLQALDHMQARAAAPAIAAAMADPDSTVAYQVLRVLDHMTESEPLQDRGVLLRCLESALTVRRSAAAFLLRAYLYHRNNPADLLLIRWLGGREVGDRPAVATLSGDGARAVLSAFIEGWDAAKSFPALRLEIADRGAELVQSRHWEGGDRALLTALQQRLAPEAPAQALAVRSVIEGGRWLDRLYDSADVIAVHIAAWIALIFAYPRLRWVQSFFFWNKWARRFLGAGYVGVAITVVPWLRRRMFLPFKASLVPQGLAEQLNESTYFEGGAVLVEKNRRPEPQRLALKDTLADVRGQVVLKGPSGLGKTLLMVRLALAAKEPAVLLRATECDKGVLAAIQKKLQGQLQDEDYLRSLIYAGGLKVLIDGLNEASPDARSRITQFVEEYFRGDFLLTTQPIGWEPPATSRVYVLQPLLPEQIGPFLLKQWAGVASRATLTREQYEASVGAYVKDLRAAGEADPRLIALSNPMDATLAAELLARGEIPDTFGLVEQRYRGMSEEFQESCGRPFRMKAFAEAVYEWRKSGKPDFRAEGFDAEVDALVRDRLMLRRSEVITKETGEEEVSRCFFRHDRIVDFFLLPAFLESPERREAHMNDEPFWGVYELLALRLAPAEERTLQQHLIEQSADTQRYELLNRYTLARLLKGGAPSPAPAAG